MRLIFDGNSQLNESLLRGEDKEFGRVITGADGKQIQVNSAGYGFEGFFDKYVAALNEFGLQPINTIVVWDGANAKQMRRNYLAGYKLGRDKAPEVSEQLNLARDMVTKALYHLGAAVVQQPRMEADDVIGYLCRHLRGERNTVVTSDGDLCVLHDDNTDVWRLKELNKNPCGPFPHRYITHYKALVGDTSDKIPGAKGFGDAAFIQFVATFGLEGLDEMQRMIEAGTLHELAESLADMPKLKTVLENKDTVTASWVVARLHIDEVNTMRAPLQIAPGMVTQWVEVPEELRVHDLRMKYGTKTLVTASNYDVVVARLPKGIHAAPFIALDIETAEGAESDEWIDRMKAATESDRERVDVLGHELCGMSLTFGDNLQHTVYMTVNHKDSDNITVDQCRAVVELIPQTKHIVIQNRNFEFSVLYRTWGDKWADNGWSGFIPNALDTKVGASYVDENHPKKLKHRSKLHLGYEQVSFEQVTTLSGPLGTLTGGRFVREYDLVIDTMPNGVDADGVVQFLETTQRWEDRRYKMDALTAEHVFDYGCDDTICTAALHHYYKLVMEIEDTWNTYLEVETLPEYLTTLAFVQGVPISLPKLREMEVKDDERYAEGWEVMRAYLMAKGWEGTVCPEFEAPLEPSDVKLAASVLLDAEFTTKKRKLNAMAFDMREQFPDNAMATVLAAAVEFGSVEAINRMIKDNFTGEPVINFGSPKQIQNLLYHVVGAVPRIVNKMTEKQRETNEVMKEAFNKMRRARDLKVDLFSITEPVSGKDSRGKSVTLKPLLDEEREALISKASTDDSAVAYALAKDNLGDEGRAALTAFAAIKSVMTRRSLFYKTYKVSGHWRDGRIHPSLNQSEAVTRRHSSTNPNVQQLPKKGDGAAFREIILPHHKHAVVVSLDFSGQELRSIAEWSGDENLTACYVGENLRDVHSLTAAASAVHLWGVETRYDDFVGMLESPDKTTAKRAKDLRGGAKTVNFGTNYDQQAPALAIQLMVEESVAQAFIDAKDVAMPRINLWKEEVRLQAERDGYVTTMLGARRHLREALMADNRWEAAKAGRQGPNAKIQGSGAEQTKLALAGMWADRIFDGSRFNARFYMPVHDEVVFSVHRDDAVACIAAVHRRMVQPFAGMKIPVVSTISLGASFGEQIELGEHPCPQKIQKAINKVFAV